MISDESTEDFVADENVVIQLPDYHPFGMGMPGRSCSAESGYRYGFNSQEIETEITGSASHNCAEFWMYDTRIGRRWNLDPVVKFYESPFATFSGNPIKLNDPSGDNATDPSTHVDDEGNVIAKYDDGDDGVYVHKDGTTREMIDQRREGCDEMCSNPNTDGGGTYIGKLGGDIHMDWVGMYSNKLANSTNQTLSKDFTFGDWYENVKKGGDWDLKDNTETIWGVAWSYDKERKDDNGNPIFTRFISQNISFFNAADFGNYHAGFTGSMFGVPVVFQKIGAGLVEELKDITNGDFEDAWRQYTENLWFWERSSLFDNPRDYWYNTKGMADGIFMKKELNLGPGSQIDVVKVK
ncbi:MAG: hypothetical protein IPP69_18750 [Flavobacteriales bacterium]|nr:hypothetical protein [Flavobacteriales bacterium]